MAKLIKHVFRYGRRVLRVFRHHIDRFLLPRVSEIIVFQSYEAGFFSNFNCVMSYLASLDRFPNLQTIGVDWTIRRRYRSHFSFGQPEDGNIWIHFFEPLPFPPHRSILTHRMNRFLDYQITGKNATGLYRSGDAWRKRYHTAYTRYIHVRPEIERRVSEIYDTRMKGHCCLGLHIRHSLHKREQPDKRMPTIQDFIASANHFVKTQPRSTVVFLATDTAEVVNQVTEAVRAPVVIQPDVTRASADSKKQLHIGNPNPALKLGQDVLVDGLLLARCDALIHVTSNVATAVGYMNPDIEMIYCTP
jgi:hypothetical protein